MGSKKGSRSSQFVKGGKSELRRAGYQVTPGDWWRKSLVTESPAFAGSRIFRDATENTPPRLSRGKGEMAG